MMYEENEGKWILKKIYWFILVYLKIKQLIEMMINQNMTITCSFFN